MTQGDALRWFAQLTGSSVANGGLVNWAGDQGLSPTGGWNLDAAVSDDDMALLLVQLFGYNPKKFGGNHKKALQRDGINVDGGDDGLISREEFGAIVDNFGFQSRLTPIAMQVASDFVPSGFQNPNNPFFGVPFDQLPGAHGRANAASRGNRAN